MPAEEVRSQVLGIRSAGLYRSKRLLRVPAVLVRLDGHFDLSRSLKTLDALEDMRQGGQAMGLVWDVRNRIDYPSASEIQALVHRFEAWERVAILTGPEVQHTMARVATLLSSRVAAVRTTTEALSWMRGAEVTV